MQSVEPCWILPYLTWTKCLLNDDITHSPYFLTLSRQALPPLAVTPLGPTSFPFKGLHNPAFYVIRTHKRRLILIALFSRTNLTSVKYATSNIGIKKISTSF